MDVPETRFAWNGDVSLAYQVVGDGPTDLIYLPGWASNVDVHWQSPHFARFLRELAGRSRLIITDRRGWGCFEDEVDLIRQIIRCCLTGQRLTV